MNLRRVCIKPKTRFTSVMLIGIGQSIKSAYRSSSIFIRLLPTIRSRSSISSRIKSYDFFPTNNSCSLRLIRTVCEWMRFFFTSVAEYCYIIYTNDKTLINTVSENCNHQILEGCWHISEPHGYDLNFELTIFSYRWVLFDVLGGDLTLMKVSREVQLWK